MKNRIVCLIIVLSIFFVTACGGKEAKPGALPVADPGAGEAVGEAIDSFREKMEKLITEKGASEIENLDELIDEVGVRDSYTALVEKLKDFDYEIVEERASSDGNSAVVKVKITTYGFGKVLKDSLGNLMSMFLEMALSQNSSSMDYSSLEAYLVEVLQDMAALSEKDYSKTISLDVTKQNGDWNVDLEHNEEFQDAVSGGLMDALKALASLGGN